MTVPFSQRHGFVPRQELIREDAPEIVRHQVYEFLSSRMRSEYSTTLEAGEEAYQFVCTVLHRIPTNESTSAWRDVRKLLNTCAWYQVYEVLEALYRITEDGTKNGLAAAGIYEEDVNTMLQHENIGWKMKDGLLEYRGSESFEITVETAKSALDAVGRTTAREEIHKALEDLSRRPSPDLTGAVHHAMGALECVAKDVCGEEKGTLGDIVKRHPEKFPQPLGEAVSKLYGFASDKGRHIKEGGEPAQKEAELIVGIAATVATYLIRSEEQS
ncbi:MAG TPA: hypothetical protein VFK06_05450 [Candidatus Angelobacter sp.]|nr:hypothetical protein [Candidatus Angelobacter sp.]